MLLYAEAEGEILLAAGAIESPKLLLLSGVGPAEELTRLGIRVRAPLAEVGRNLQAHPRVALPFQCHAPVSLVTAFAPDALKEFQVSGWGSWSSTGFEAAAFVSSEARTPADAEGQVDLQIIDPI